MQKGILKISIKIVFRVDKFSASAQLNNMAGMKHNNKHFPLGSIRSVVNLFRTQLDRDNDVDLALLSIVLGYIENTLTMNRSLHGSIDEMKLLAPIFPVVEADDVYALYDKFTALIKGTIDLTKYETTYATRELVKRVSDVIWGSLTRTYYKDKAHLQSIFSFLTGEFQFAENILMVQPRGGS